MRLLDRSVYGLWYSGDRFVGPHSYTLLRYCAKDQTYRQVFNKDIKFTLLEAIISCLGL